MPRPTPPPPTRRRPPRRRFLRGVAQTLAIILGFVTLGVVAASLASPGRYPTGRMDREPENSIEPPELWLVDGFNALHVALLRGRERPAWWRSRERERLLQQVAGFDGGEVVVVFDGPRPLPEGEGAGAGLRVVFAPSADEWLLGRVREASEPARVAVVTADRQLADRARHRGARVVSPKVFLERCSEASGSIQAASSGTGGSESPS
jgi:predicted RNA-binding protein with PIN domain